MLCIMQFITYINLQYMYTIKGSGRLKIVHATPNLYFTMYGHNDVPRRKSMRKQLAIEMHAASAPVYCMQLV